MHRIPSLLLLAALAVALLITRPATGADKAPLVYAYCVEMGTPGIKPRSLADQAKLLKELGYDGGGFAVLAGPRAAETLKACDDAGIKVFLLQTSIRVGPKATKPYDPAALEAIRGLKGRPGLVVVVTVDGLKPGDPEGWEPAIKALREFGDAAAQSDVRISCYNHVNSWNESVPLNMELVKKVNHPRVGYNFNVCHWLKVEGNKDYKPLLKASAEKLFCVTICGAKVDAKTWTNGLIQPLDQGDWDNKALLATLKEIGYAGPIGIMCYGIPGDARDYLQASMKTWKQWHAAP